MLQHYFTYPGEINIRQLTYGSRKSAAVWHVVQGGLVEGTYVLQYAISMCTAGVLSCPEDGCTILTTRNIACSHSCSMGKVYIWIGVYKSSRTHPFPHNNKKTQRTQIIINKQNTNQQRKRGQQGIKQQISTSLNTLRLISSAQNQKQSGNQSTLKKNIKRKQTNYSKGTIEHNSKENNYKQEKPREIKKKTKNIACSHFCSMGKVYV